MKLINYKIIILSVLVILVSGVVYGQSDFRRPISPQEPAWLIHIDTWNWADPQKIIDLVPEDIRPYVIFNISLSVNWSEEEEKWMTVQYGYETAKSWIRTLADNQMWAMIQPSSGGQSHFPDYDETKDYDSTLYGEFFQDYPNFLGFNYCEQFWGFDQSGFTPSAIERWEHLANLLELSNKYGGYLVVTFADNQWNADINPLAMLKRSPTFREAAENYSENYIHTEKHTQQAYKFDHESVALGLYLSGYSGQYGIRYDETGWTDADGEHDNYTLATGIAAHLERLMLAGATIIDGPELIWRENFRELSTATTDDGYTTRRWGTFPQFENISVDIFRKILDGTIRIPSRKEVIDRTKVLIINDINVDGDKWSLESMYYNEDDRYRSPKTLFEGLYRMEDDGNRSENKSFFKKTGRYPAIPVAYGLNDNLANEFQIQVNSSDYSNRWPDIDSKVNEFNSLFPQEYTGDIYAGRQENGWVIYNPFKNGQTSRGKIPFKYNSSEYMEINLPQYTAGVVKEYPDSLTFYLNNFDNILDTDLKTSTIKIYGSDSQPDFSYQDRGTDYQTDSKISSDWSNGVFTLTVKHNGPVDIKVNASGSESDRLTEFTSAPVTPPEEPPFYTGPRQYEAEHWDYRNILNNVSNGIEGDILNYTGQGYMKFGADSKARARAIVNAPEKGRYILKTRYSVRDDISTIDLYVNGSKVVTPTFKKSETLSDWAINTQEIELKEGKNTIEFRANASGESTMYFDNLVLIGNYNVHES
ncbi:MAG: glycoside hydrolase family 98 domain-containing protein [Halanaerobiaceae bacterium]